jgi:hypothetical protein
MCHLTSLTGYAPEYEVRPGPPHMRQRTVCEIRLTEVLLIFSVRSYRYTSVMYFITAIKEVCCFGSLSSHTPSFTRLRGKNYKSTPWRPL